MAQPKTIALSKQVQLHTLYAPQFKTMRVSVHCFVPLKEQTASSMALLPFLLTRACQDYPDFTALSRRLLELYGASVSADVGKIGDNQVLSFTAGSIADAYCLEGEKLGGELSHLLCQMLFTPPFDDDGQFRTEDVEQERRQTLETIASDFNDKRVYAKNRCEEILCKGEPYGLPRYGTKEQVLALTREELKDAWQHLLSTAQVEILVLGNCQVDAVAEGFAKAFYGYPREPQPLAETIFVKRAESMETVTETMQVAQSKLVLGLRAGVEFDSFMEMPMRLMTALYGGTPHSKLFLNVREKLSLCYYCSASYNAAKGILLVQSGVETKNLAAAEAEILAQLKRVQQGDFTKEELESAKLSLYNAYRTVEDSLGGMEHWYLAQVFRKKQATPIDSVRALEKVTREQVVDAAHKVSLATVYQLVGEGQ